MTDVFSDGLRFINVDLELHGHSVARLFNELSRNLMRVAGGRGGIPHRSTLRSGSWASFESDRQHICAVSCVARFFSVVRHLPPPSIEKWMTLKTRVLSIGYESSRRHKMATRFPPNILQWANAMACEIEVVIYDRKR